MFNFLKDMSADKFILNVIAANLEGTLFIYVLKMCISLVSLSFSGCEMEAGFFRFPLSQDVLRQFLQEVKREEGTPGISAESLLL